MRRLALYWLCYMEAVSDRITVYEPSQASLKNFDARDRVGALAPIANRPSEMRNVLSHIRYSLRAVRVLALRNA